MINYPTWTVFSSISSHCLLHSSIFSSLGEMMRSNCCWIKFGVFMIIHVQFEVFSHILLHCFSDPRDPCAIHSHQDSPLHRYMKLHANPGVYTSIAFQLIMKRCSAQHPGLDSAHTRTIQLQKAMVPESYGWIHMHCSRRISPGFTTCRFQGVKQ